MRPILWAAVLAVILTLSVTLAIHWPGDPVPSATPTPRIGKMKKYDTDQVAKRLVELRGMC